MQQHGKQQQQRQPGSAAYPGVSTYGLEEAGYGQQAAAINAETQQQNQYLDQISQGLDQLKFGAQVGDDEAPWDSWFQGYQRLVVPRAFAEPGRSVWLCMQMHGTCGWLWWVCPGVAARLLVGVGRQGVCACPYSGPCTYLMVLALIVCAVCLGTTTGSRRLRSFSSLTTLVNHCEAKIG
jgi:hypothetical protein